MTRYSVRGKVVAWVFRHARWRHRTERLESSVKGRVRGSHKYRFRDMAGRGVGMRCGLYWAEDVRVSLSGRVA